MTYLQLVNHVLRRMREDTVSSVAETEYSTMVGDFVNDAVALVEQAYDWSALRTTYTITTTDGIFNYALTGAGQNITELRVINDSSNWFMGYRPQAWFDDKFLNNTPLTGEPKYWTYNGTDSNGDTLVDLYPIPQGIQTIRFNVVARSAELTGENDVVTVPHLPVVHMAIALLARERGETGGTSTQEYFSIADRFLSDAIQYDANKHSEETIWYS